MDVNSIIMIVNMLAAKYPLVLVVLAALGSLVVFGLALVALTPSKADDAVVSGWEANAYIGPVLRALKAFSPIQKK